MAAFYAPDATYLSVPFRQPDRGVERVRAYLTRELLNQTNERRPPYQGWNPNQ